MPLSRVSSPLTPDLESLVERTIRSCLTVHRELGPGLNEAIYSKACCLEFAANGLQCEREKVVAVRYRDEMVCHQRIDLVVEERLVLEIKSVERFHPVHTAQLAGYLRIAGLRVGLLINFNVRLLKYGIRRVVL